MQVATRTVVIDPSTHVPRQRTTFALPANDYLGTFRLGGLGAYGAVSALNSSSGLAGCIDSITLNIAGATVNELRNASVYMAWLAAQGSADAGDSVGEKTSLSNQRFVPYTAQPVGPVAAESTVVCSRQLTGSLNLAGVVESYFQLWKALPFLEAIGVLQASKMQVTIEILYQQSLQNLLPLSDNVAQAATVITAPYLICEQLLQPLTTMPPRVPFMQLVNDMVTIPAFSTAADPNGTAQQTSVQSRGFIGRQVQDVLVCKCQPTWTAAEQYTGGADASYAQDQETIRLWADGQQMTSINTNSALLGSYCEPHRAPLILQRPIMYAQLGQMGDDNTNAQLGARSYELVPINKKVEQNIQIDYSRTAYSPGWTNAGNLGFYPAGVRAINLQLYARCLRVFAFDAKTGAVVY